MGRLIVITGPSGAGKGSVVAGLRRERNFHFSVSATTRRARPNEREGVNYYFIDRDEFEQWIAAGDFLEWAEYNGNLYGTPRRAVLEALAAGNDVLLEIELRGAQQIRDAYPDAVMIFIVPPDLRTLERRLRGRGDTADAEVERRMEIARHEIKEAPDVFDYIVVNDELDQAIAEVGGILDSSQGADFP